MNIREDLIREMKEQDFEAEEIEKIANDEGMLKFVEHLIQTGDAQSVYELFGDTGFIEHLEQQLIEPITFEEMIGQD